MNIADDSDIPDMVDKADVGCREIIIRDNCPVKLPLPPMVPSSPPPLVAGHSLLGKGFNTFGRLNTSSARNLLFDTSATTARTWLSPFCGEWFAIPDNVDDPILLGEQSGGSQIFGSRTAVSEYFSVEAGMSGSYRAFSGEFDMAFSDVASAMTEYDIGLYWIKSKQYKLRLRDASLARLADSVTTDEDYTRIPDRFIPGDHDNNHAYFAFFEKYGTHFVNEVELGGRLNYYVHARKSTTESTRKFSENLRLEVDAVFLSGKGNESAEWKALGEKWAKERTVRIEATGGNSILNALSPRYDDNFHELYVAWLIDARTNPMPMGIKLRPIHSIFSGEKAQGMEEALRAYAEPCILLNAVGRRKVPSAPSEPGTGFINLNDRAVTLEPAYDSKFNEGLKVLVLARRPWPSASANCFRIPRTSKGPITPRP